MKLLKSKYRVLREGPHCYKLQRRELFFFWETISDSTEFGEYEYKFETETEAINWLRENITGRYKNVSNKVLKYLDKNGKIVTNS